MSERHAIGDDQVAPDLDGSGAPGRRGQGAGGLLLEKFADARAVPPTLNPELGWRTAA